MGRFSKLETDPAAGDPDDGDDADPLARRVGPASAPGYDIPATFGRRLTRRDDAAEAAPGPSFDAAHYQKEGEALFRAGDHRESLRKFSRAIQQDHSKVDPWIGQIRCLVALRQGREGLSWAKRGLELFPEDPRLVSVQGLAYAANGMVSRGLACSDYALGRHGEAAGLPFVWMMRGAVLAMGDNRNAESCFDKAMEARSARGEGDDWTVPFEIGLMLLDMRKPAMGVKFLEQAVQEGAAKAFVWERLGWARERLGMGAKAIEAYQAAVEIDPDNRKAGEGLARVGGSSVFTRIYRRWFR